MKALSLPLATLFLVTVLLSLFSVTAATGLPDSNVLRLLPDGEALSALQQTVVWYLLLPRTLMALLMGAAMGVAGVLVQQATRNPFASPATLGVNAGALLAIVIGGVVWPTLTAQWPVAVAFSGAVLTTVIVFRLSRAISDSPLNLVLVGMAVTLSLGAISAGLLMFWENRLDGLYIWGAGNLVQHDFSGFSRSWPWVFSLTLLAILMARRLDLLELGDELASGFGVDVRKTVAITLLLALLLSALVVSQVGMISFVGLIAPHIARGLGYRRAAGRLLVAALVGAMLLLGADVLARLLAGRHYSLPAGSMTTLIGAPFMIYLLLRRRSFSGMKPPAETGIRSLRRVSPGRFMGVMLLLLVVVSYGSLSHNLAVDWFELRWPRVLAALLAGAALGLAGLVLQSLMRNPLASPDVSGLTTTGVLFVVLGTVLLPGLSRLEQVWLSLAGSGLALMLLVAVGRLTGFRPQLFALVGICLSAAAATLINIALVLGSNQASDVLLWLSGSTYAVDPHLVGLLALSLTVVVPLLAARWRQLDILSLGEYWPALLGIRVSLSIVVLLLVVAILGAVSVAVVGGISFVGLMAPHIARLFGLSSHRHLLPASALIGALLLVLGDWLSRALLFPFELPAGLVVSAVGGLYFIVLLLTGKYIQRS